MQRAFEKIVERLEELKHDNPMVTNRYVLRNEAIEIVNEVASECGVCEHKYHRTIDYVRMFKTSCLHELSEDCVKKYEFCPYCGKSIIRLEPDKPSKVSNDILKEIRRIDRMTRERMSESYKAESKE